MTPCCSTAAMAPRYSSLRPTAGARCFTRNLGNIVMDLNDVERIELNALGSADTFNIGDVSATDVREVVIDLRRGRCGRPTRINASAPRRADAVTIATVGAETQVNGLPAQLRILGAEAGE